MKYLAVITEDPDKLWTEDDPRSVADGILSGRPVAYYPINFDENNVPSLGPAISVGGAPAAPARRIEQRELLSGGAVVGEAEVIIEADDE